jgi:hypothetical protein
MTTVQYLESLRRMEISKCHFYTPQVYYDTPVRYAPGYACLNDAQVEIEENNFIADENGTRVTGTYWKPFCWDCMVATISNPSAIQGIRMVN